MVFIQFSQKLMAYIKHSKLLSYNKTKHGVITYLFVLIAPCFSFSQNLVPNPSFNDVIDCDISSWSATVQSVENWYASIGSPDFFNYCFNPPRQAPNTFAGYSDPLNGSSMAGVGLGRNNTLNIVSRETISVELTNTLEKNLFYCVSFFYKNAQSDGLTYSTEMLSGMFTHGTITVGDLENTTVKMKNQVNEVYNGWTKFKSYYQPNGGENTFSIGYFGVLDYYHELPNEPFHNLYYFIDSVRVEECDKDSTLSIVLELPNVFTPNGDEVNDFYIVKANNLVALEVNILNRWGNLVSQFDGLTHYWDGKAQNGSMCSDGVYFVKAIGETKDGDIIMKHGFIHLITN
jgi:gliding motility-associated-like protein